MNVRGRYLTGACTDEILFGRLVVEDMPRIVREWVDIHTQTNTSDVSRQDKHDRVKS